MNLAHMIIHCQHTISSSSHNQFSSLISIDVSTISIGRFTLHMLSNGYTAAIVLDHVQRNLTNGQ